MDIKICFGVSNLILAVVINLCVIRFLKLFDQFFIIILKLLQNTGNNDSLIFVAPAIFELDHDTELPASDRHTDHTSGTILHKKIRVLIYIVGRCKVIVDLFRILVNTVEVIGDRFPYIIRQVERICKFCISKCDITHWKCKYRNAATVDSQTDPVSRSLA